MSYLTSVIAYKPYESAGAIGYLSGITLGYEHWYTAPWAVTLLLSDNKLFIGP